LLKLRILRLFVEESEKAIEELNLSRHGCAVSRSSLTMNANTVYEDSHPWTSFAPDSQKW